MTDTFKISLTESERAEFEERAAILEFEAGYTRAEAESIVKNWILRTRQLKNSNGQPALAPQIDWIEETKHLNVGRAFAELQNLCKCSIGLEINEYRDYYQSIERAVDELCETENLNESQIEKMRQRKTVIALHFYPETPIGFCRVIGSDLEEVLRAAVAKLAETTRPKVDEHK